MARVDWQTFGWQETLGTLALLSLSGLGLLLLCGAILRHDRPPFYGMLGQLSFYQTVVALTLFGFVTALFADEEVTPVLFAALAGSLLFGYLVWRWLMPAGTLAKRVGNLLFSATLFIVLFEGVLFGASQLVAHPLFTPLNPDSEARINAWRLKPGSTWMGQRVNQKGFCDMDRPRPKPSGVFRIVVLADSFGIGFVPYEHHFIPRLEQMLNAAGHSDRRYEVINLSVASIGPAEYHWLLVHEALPLDPDLVICCVFTGNDFTDNQPVERGPFHRESYLTFRVLRRAAAIFQNRHRVESASSQSVGRSFSPADYFRLERAGLEICLPARMRELSPPALESLDSMADLVPGRFLLAIMPREYQVNDSWWNELMAGDPAPERYDRQLPTEILIQFCDERALPYADPLEALQQFPQTTYLPRDTHWNVAGNRIAAEVLAERVETIVP